MPTGHYPRKQRVQHVAVACPTCGTTRTYWPSFIKQHPTIRFCSRICAGKAAIKPDTYLDLICSCGKTFKKRHDQAKRAKVSHCSPECAHQARRVDGAKWRDPQQIREYMRLWAEKNRDRVNEQHRKWGRKNRDKTRLNLQKRRAARFGVDATVTLSQWNSLKELYGNACAKCHEIKPLEMDHIVPVTKGGKHVIENIQPLCRRCNASKGARIIRYNIRILEV